MDMGMRLSMGHRDETEYGNEAGYMVWGIGMRLDIYMAWG